MDRQMKPSGCDLIETVSYGYRCRDIQWPKRCQLVYRLIFVHQQVTESLNNSLFIAAQGGQASTIELLHHLGADVNAVDYDGTR